MPRPQFIAIFLLSVLPFGCATTAEPTRDLQAVRGGRSETILSRPFFPDCQPFEVVDFGHFPVLHLKGVTLFENQGEERLLESVQIAVQVAGEEEALYALSSRAGRFDMGKLPPGVYDVWTCKPGYDEVRFRISLAPQNEDSEILIFMGLSEGDGRRDVVLSR